VALSVDTISNFMVHIKTHAQIWTVIKINWNSYRALTGCSFPDAILQATGYWWLNV
jgi:hypothetical protein